jgi:DHA1 family bicyclomycin/chloramphenicol resistance-like MFS transporter
VTPRYRVATPLASSERRAGGAELVVLLAAMTSLVALSIDVMLPALPAIAGDLGIERENDRQLIITVLFLGLAAAQIFYGPISDAVGRKPAIYAGLILFMGGCVLSMTATSLRVMLIGRFLQGVGAAGPRILTVALVRDLHRGREMARVMSLISSVFILVPIVAPSIGQGILALASWPAVFGVLLAQGLIAFAWFAWRQPETLPPARRTPFQARRIAAAFRETLRSRVTVGYTLASGLVSGAFVGYLTSSQQILQEQYRLGDLFPVTFASLAVAIGTASVVNARLVMRLGMRRLAGAALTTQSALSVLFLVAALFAGGEPPLWTLMIYLLAAFFCLGLLFGNFNALAMEPLGHIAGTAAAVVGSMTSFVSLGLGTLVGQAYDGTVRPLVAGFAILSVAAAGCMAFAERGRPAE